MLAAAAKSFRGEKKTGNEDCDAFGPRGDIDLRCRNGRALIATSAKIVETIPERECRNARGEEGYCHACHCNELFHVRYLVS